MVAKCPSCNRWTLNQSKNPRYFNCTACGDWFRIHQFIPERVGSGKAGIITKKAMKG